jgi:O-antigen/teichoic acid export membrane protein
MALDDVQRDDAATPTDTAPAAQAVLVRAAAPAESDGQCVANLSEPLSRDAEPLSLGLSVTLGASVLSILLGVDNNVVMARLLGPAFKGHIDLVNSTIGLMANLTGSSLAVGLIYVIAKRQANQRRLAAMMVVAAVVQSACAYGVLLVFARTKFITALVPQDFMGWAIPWIAAGTLGALLVLYWRSFLAGVQWFTACALLDVAGKALIVVAMVTAVAVFHRDPHAASVAGTISLVAAMLLPAVIAPAALKKQFARGVGDSRFGEVCRYSVPCYLGHVVQSLNYRLDVFLIAYFSGDESLGLYVIAVAVGQLLWLPSHAVQSVLFPRLSSTEDERSRADQAAQFVRLLLTLTVVLSLGMAVVGPYLVVWVFSGAFAGSVVSLWLLLPGIAVFAATNVLAAYFSAIGRPGINLAVASVALVATIVLNLLLLPRIGIAGAAIASTVSYTISTVLSLWVFWHKTGHDRWSTVIISGSDVRQIARWMAAQTARLVG